MAVPLPFIPSPLHPLHPTPKGIEMSTWHVEFKSPQFPPASTSVEASRVEMDGDSWLFFRSSPTDRLVREELVLAAPAGTIQYAKRVD